MCNGFIGNLISNVPVANISKHSLDITSYRVYRREEYFHWFQPVLLPAFDRRFSAKICNTITQTTDGKYWLHFDSDTDAALFKLTYL
jgi:hypothetical protein